MPKKEVTRDAVQVIPLFEKLDDGEVATGEMHVMTGSLCDNEEQSSRFKAAVSNAGVQIGEYHTGQDKADNSGVNGFETGDDKCDDPEHEECELVENIPDDGESHEPNDEFASVSNAVSHISF
jgi:hypothetical protein